MWNGEKMEKNSLEKQVNVKNKVKIKYIRNRLKNRDTHTKYSNTQKITILFKKITILF